MVYSIIYKDIKVYRKKTLILDNIELGIRKDKLTAILGLSGAGKTTLIEILSGHQKNGQIFIRINKNHTFAGDENEAITASEKSLENKKSGNSEIKSRNIADEKTELINYEKKGGNNQEIVKTVYGGDLANKSRAHVIEIQESNPPVPNGSISTEKDFKMITNFQVKQISSMVYQNDVLPPWLTVKEYLVTLCQLNGNSHSRMKKLLKDFGLENRTNCEIGIHGKGLSGGQRKRLSIIAEILSNREILFLDEPTTGLDVNNAIKVIKSLKKKK